MAAPNDDPLAVMSAEAGRAEVAQPGTWAALGEMSLRDIARYVDGSRDNRVRFAAACALLAECLPPELLATAESAQTVPEPLALVRELPVQNPPADIAGSEVVATGIGGEAAAISRPDAAEAEETADLHPNAKRFLLRLTGGDALPAGVTQSLALGFVDELAGVYRLARKMYPETVDARLREVRFSVEGKTDHQIVELTGNPSVGNVSQGRHNYVKTLRGAGYSPEKMQTMLVAYLGGYGLDETVGRLALAVDSPTETETATDPEPEATPAEPAVNERVAPEEVEETGPDEWDELIDLCGLYWNETDLASLQALLRNQNGKAVEAARYHIAALMAGFASMRPGNGSSEADSIPFVQWETLNLLVAFNVPQGQQALTIEQVAQRMYDRYERKGTNVEPALSGGLSTLIKYAEEHYQRGWYPAPRATVQAERTDAPAPREESEDAPGEFATVLAQLLPRHAQLAQREALEKHISGEEITTTDRNLQLGLMELRTVVANAGRLRYGVLPRKQREKRMLTDREARLLSSLMGDATNGRSPMRFSALLRQRQEKDADFTAADLHAEILAAIKKLK